MSAFRSTAVFLPLLCLAACFSDDPFDPCAEVGGCGVEGFDLALAIAEIEWTGDQQYDERVGGRLVQPGDPLTFRYTVVNRGTEVSEPTTLALGTIEGSDSFSQPVGLVQVEIPALEPGDHVSGTRSLDAPVRARLNSNRAVAGFWIHGYFGSHPDDSDGSNDERLLFYHVAAGYANLSVRAGSEPWRVGDDDSVYVTIRNPSPSGALQGDLQIYFCALAVYPESAPYGCWNAFHFRALETIPADGVRREELELTLPADALPIEDFEVVGLRVCLRDNAAPWQSQVCADDPTARLVQDLDIACSPPTVALPATLDASATESDCGDIRPYDVWSFDASASAVHTIEAVAGDLDHVLVFHADHERLIVNGAGQFFVPEAGRYHIVVLPSAAAPLYDIQ